MENKTSIKGFFNKSSTITNKEKKLLIILLFVIFLWLINKLVLTTQASELNNLEHKRLSYNDELKKLDGILEKENLLNIEHSDLSKQINDLRTKYFIYLDQPSILHMLNKIIDETKLEILSMSFSEPSTEELNNNIKVKYLTVSVPFEGNYVDLILLLQRIKENQPKLLVRDLSLSKTKDNLVNGQLELDIYSITDNNEDFTSYTYQTDSINVIKEDPFAAFKGYKEFNENEAVNTSSPEGLSLTDAEENKTILENFENNDVYFMPSASSVTGRVSILNKAKYGKYSLRTEYFISTYDKEERAYVVLDDKNIIMKYPPPATGLWIYSYGYSPVTIGLRFKDEEGDTIDLELTEGINWMGWRYLEAMPPQDINLYPLKLDRIYIQLAANKDIYGVFLFDNLEMTNPKTENDKNEVQVDNNYIFYVVQYGDTLESISENMYGTKSKAIEIMKENGLSDVNIELGQVLVIPK